MRAKYEIGRVVKYKSGEVIELGSIDKIVICLAGMAYIIKGISVNEEDILASYTQDIVRKKKVYKKKVLQPIGELNKSEPSIEASPF